MSSRQTSSSSRRGGPLEESRAANRSISASFSGTKASLASTQTAKRSTSSASSSSKPRTVSSKHKNRFEEDDDIEEEEEGEDNDSYDDEEADRRPSSKGKPAATKARSAAVSPVHRESSSRQASGDMSRQVSAQHANKSVLARGNPNASMIMGGGNSASMAYQASRVAALARSHGASDASAIMRPRGQVQTGVPGTSIDPASVGAVSAAASASLRVDTSSFEEWMKMATDNKINSTNTWSFALIDYFHDMSLLRNDSGDGTINFQKASCTLDGCVKVWTSRVDSVVVETGKLLSGLQDDLDQATGKDKRDKGSGDADDDDDDDEDGENGSSNRQKKKRNREATLAKNFSQIQIKKFDLEFTVDPLFKKTSADFDEGGAGGLLMNHLGVDSNMRVIFDAGDVAGVGDDDEEMGEINDTTDPSDRDARQSVVHDTVDLTKLREKLFNPQDFEDPGDAPLSANLLLAGRVLCPTLCNFRFSKDDDTPFGVGMEDFNDQTFHAMDAHHGYDLPTLNQRGQTEDFDGGFQDDMNPMLDNDNAGDVDFFANLGGDMPGDDDDDDGAGDFFDAPDSVPALNHGGRVVIDGTTGHVEGGYGPFDPSAGPSSEIVMAMAFNGESGQADDGGDGANAGGMFDYFDQRLMRNWAGPEHWKLSRVTGPLGVGALSGAEGAAAKAEAALARKENKKSKEPFVIDFLSEEGAVSSKEIFEPAKQAALISLPASARAKSTNATLLASNKDAYLLPEDRHFSSKQLLRLFLKPRVAINMRRKGGAVVDNKLVDDWASLPDDDGDALQGALGDNGDDGEMAFDNQFFHDADDGNDGGADDGLARSGAANGDLEDEDLMQTMQALNRVKPEYVNYAKKATRVDIKKLKENIWKELDIPQSTNTPDLSAASSSAGDDDEDTDGPITPTKGVRSAEKVKTFNSVISGLKKAYTQDRLEEISTSFCFICLLHLANEEGLALSTGTGSQIEQLQSKKPLGNGKIISSSQDDDDLGGELDDLVEEGYEVDDARVGTLELLQIAKDPKAYRSA